MISSSSMRRFLSTMSYFWSSANYGRDYWTFFSYYLQILAKRWKVPEIVLLLTLSHLRQIQRESSKGYIIDKMKRQRPLSLDNQEKQQTTTKVVKLKAPFLKSPNFSAKDIKYQNELDRKYFRQEVVELSKSLLGKVMIRKTQNGIIKAVIVQTEAYKAPLDKGCHAYNNKKTEKTKYFWLDGGHLYIYTIYMPTNICLNVVAGLEGQPEAVLIRAVQPIEGIDIVRSLRNIQSNKAEDLSNGPGKVGQALGINKETMNGIDLVQGQFKIVDAGIEGFEMGISRRVNIDYAEEWIDTPWRFFVKGNTFVSKVNFNAPKKQKKSSKSQGDKNKAVKPKQ